MVEAQAKGKKVKGATTDPTIAGGGKLDNRVSKVKQVLQTQV